MSAAVVVAIQAASSAAAILLNVAIAHCAVGVHVPALETIVVIVRRQSACGDEGGTRRLNVTRLVRASRDDRRFAAVPLPFEAEPGECLFQNRSLQLGLLPGLAAVDAHLHAADGTAPRPREAGDLMHALATQL